MKYLLTILTNGRRDCLERTLAAFDAFVTPHPAHVFVMDDGGQTRDAVSEKTLASLLGRYGPDWSYEDSPLALGMCAAHARCWAAARVSDYDWAFHIEDDQLILRPVDLRSLADVLERGQYLKQMALVRCPWGAEVEWGGYIPQAPGWYERHGNGVYEWIETTRNWATSPALFRTEFAAEFPWPAEAGCETTIGPQIVARYPDARFGLWGWGEPMYAHVGVNRQPGSFGY